jgi:hypothetical protein
MPKICENKAIVTVGKNSAHLKSLDLPSHREKKAGREAGLDSANQRWIALPSTSPPSKSWGWCLPMPAKLRAALRNSHRDQSAQLLEQHQLSDS